MKLTVAFSLLLLLVIHLFTAIKVYKKAKQKGGMVSPVWLIVITFVPILGPLSYLVAGK